MEEVSISELILSLEKWDKVCDSLNIERDKILIENAISILKSIKVLTLDELLDESERKVLIKLKKNKFIDNSIEYKEKKDISNVEKRKKVNNITSTVNKPQELFNEILVDYYNDVDLEKKYKFKLIKNKKSIDGQVLKKLWGKCNFKREITIKELSIIYCILTNSKTKINKRNKLQFITLIDNVVSNINRDNALNNIVV